MVHSRFSFVVFIFVFFVAKPVDVFAQLLTGFNESEIVQPVEAFQTRFQKSEQPLKARQADPLQDLSYDETQPVDLQADDLSYDETGRIVIATGNVILEQAGRILRADVIRYDLNADRVTASGDVVLNELNGDIYYASEAELRNKLKDGAVKGMRSYLADGSQFSAKQGRREGGVKTVLEGASYTACEPCEDDPDADPIWQIRASKVRHDKEEQRISYSNARLEFVGVPVFYTPYLSHSDGSVEQKSGLIAPSAGFTSDLGFFVTNNYYIALAPDKDATVGLMTSTQEVPLGLLEYRQRWRDASLEFNGGVTYSGRRSSSAGMTVIEDEEVRGFLKADARWDMNDKWRSGIKIDWASDDQFLRQYDLDRRDVLENEIFAERFDGRDYAVGRLLTFQDTRIGESQVLDQPEVLPEIITSFVGAPNSVPVIGGRWQADGSLLGLRREGNDQDTARLSLGLGWQKRLVSDYGLLTRIDTAVRGDLYNIRDLSGDAGDTTENRVFPQMHLQSSYPLARQFESSQVRVAPVAALTFAPNVGDGKIPNEDSQDVQIDTSNLFNANRFAGLDRVEDGSRATYGLQTGIYGNEGGFLTAFLGQSYRFDNDNPFPVGSGLNDQDSDIVGQVQALYADNFNMNYKFQLSNENLASTRHEVDLEASIGSLSFDMNYLFAKALEGTDIDESREQVDARAIYNFTDEWAIRSGAIHDLGEDPGLRRTFGALDYQGQCLFWSLTGVRNFTDDASGDSDTEIFLRIGLKNLGEFQSAGL